MAPKKPLLAITVLALVAIELGGVAGAWSDVVARRPDFFDFYSAARVIRSGIEPAYNQPNRTPPGNLKPFSDPANRIDTLHPPFESVLFLPLSWMSYLHAYKIWLGCNLVMLWSVPLLLWRHLPRLHRDFHFILIGYGSFLPVQVALIQGQDAIVLLLLVTWAFLALQRNAEFTAGSLLGLAMFKFNIVLTIAAGLLLSRRQKTRLALGFLCSCLTLVLISIALVGMQGTIAYFRGIAGYGASVSSSSKDHVQLMPNLRGLLSAILPYSAKQAWAPALSIALSLVFFLGGVFWARRRSGLTVSLQLSLFVLIAVAASYHFYFHNAVLLLLPVLLTADEVATGEIGKRTYTLFGIAACAMYVVPLLAPLEIGAFVLGVSSIVLIAILLHIPKGSSALVAKAPGEISLPMS